MRFTWAGVAVVAGAYRGLLRALAVHMGHVHVPSTSTSTTPTPAPTPSSTTTGSTRGWACQSVPEIAVLQR